EITSFYHIFEQHFQAYVGTYEERLEHHCDPLRPVVSRTVEAFLDCGRLLNGFARIRCPSCGGEHVLAFSYQTCKLVWIR
ncbi:transposase zinc-binding domain-containing protein, partial [Candidatus Eisenbacteria bacterium]